MYVLRMSVVCCQRRNELNTDDYWFGLYKETATPAGTVKWYDGNPSNYTTWAQGYPKHSTTCVRYTKDGFKDGPCSDNCYYTCKKQAGLAVFLCPGDVVFC